MKLVVFIFLGICSLVENEDASHFTVNLYNEIAKDSPNTFMVCPVSIKIVLALVQTGSGGKTAEEITNLLNLPKRFNAFNNNIHQLLVNLRGNKNYILKNVIKMYVKNGYPIKKEYRRRAKNIFKAEIQNINFTKTQDGAKEINNWVARRTNNKIKELVSPDNLSGDPILVLLNAVYFHGTWVTKFPKEKTQKRDFYRSNDTIKVDMMKVKSKFNVYYSQTLPATFLEIPYNGKDVTMTIILPSMGQLSILEAHITECLLPVKYKKRETFIVIPKFKITTNVDFRDILQRLGVREAFNKANFSGISNSPLYISALVQKTFIEVNEEGTRASAASVAVKVTRSTARELVVDHPFIFYLKSKAGVLFIGRYTGM